MGFLPWAPIGGNGRNSVTRSGNSLEAKRHDFNPVQLALAWLLQKSPVMLPIPGTANIAHLEQNMAAAKIQLSPEEWKKIEAAA
jgi:aryl-alcohol dehydrogenase-like predicted oxidoreductase